MTATRIETVEELDAADYGPYRGGGDEPGPDETTCRNCGHLAIEHADGATAYSVCPSAPVATPAPTLVVTREAVERRAREKADRISSREGLLPFSDLSWGIVRGTWLAAMTDDLAALGVTVAAEVQS